MEYKEKITYSGRGTEQYCLKIYKDGTVEGTCKKQPIQIIILGGRRYVNNHHLPIFHLVWEAFNGHVPKGYVIHHKNHNKLDDNLENLCLMTKSEHSKHHMETDKEEWRQKLKEGNKNRSWNGINNSFFWQTSY